MLGHLQDMKNEDLALEDVYTYESVHVSNIMDSQKRFKHILVPVFDFYNVLISNTFSFFNN